MCSTGDDGLRDMEPDQCGTLDGVSQTAGKCNKCECDVECTYKLKFRAPECRDCYLAYVCHKFRAALGSSKLLPRGAKVLLVFDGSADAVTLLDMLHTAQIQSTYKRINCVANVLYIEEATCDGQLNVMQHQRVEQLRAVRDFLLLYPQMQSYVAPLQHYNDGLALHEVQEMDDYLDCIQELSNATVHKYVTTLQSLTARQDCVKQLKQRQIVSIATQLQCDFVFLPDISTTVATELLAAVALGRGGNVGLDVALLDDRYMSATGVRVLRPIRDLTQSEVQLYLHAKQLQPLKMDISPPSGATSIYNLTKAFVNGLQSNYNSTVSTVYRTGNKISAHVDSKRNSCDDRCALCMAPLQPTDSPTLLAIEFSRLVSSTGAALQADQIVSTAKTKTEHDNGLCHACSNIRNENNNKHFLLT